MSVEEELSQLAPKKGMALTIGVFDGVHLGHKYLISQLKEQAKPNLLSGVVTFRQHPREILSPQTRMPRLTTLAQRMKLIKDEDVDEIIAMSFTRELANLSALQFITLLHKHLKMQVLVIGPDFALGKNREGNTSTLPVLGQEMNFRVVVVPPLLIDGEMVSSTVIRNALAGGDMRRVHNLVGRYFSVSGRVITGAHRGVELGFPTANLGLDPEQALPADGVYASRAYISESTYESMTYIGKRPTFGNKQHVVEVYLLDYQGDLYGQELKIDIIEHLRGDRQFGTAEELAKQIAEDVRQGKAILTSRGGN